MSVRELMVAIRQRYIVPWSGISHLLPLDKPPCTGHRVRDKCHQRHENKRVVLFMNAIDLL